MGKTLENYYARLQESPVPEEKKEEKELTGKLKLKLKMEEGKVVKIEGSDVYKFNEEQKQKTENIANENKNEEKKKKEEKALRKEEKLLSKKEETGPTKRSDRVQKAEEIQAKKHQPKQETKQEQKLAKTEERVPKVRVEIAKEDPDSLALDSENLTEPLPPVQPNCEEVVDAVTDKIADEVSAGKYSKRPGRPRKATTTSEEKKDEPKPKKEEPKSNKKADAKLKREEQKPEAPTPNLSSGRPKRTIRKVADKDL